jgi:hypothetical protein
MDHYLKGADTCSGNCSELLSYPTRVGRPEFVVVLEGRSSARSRSLIPSRDKRMWTRIFCMSNSTRAMMWELSHSSHCLLNMGLSRLLIKGRF